MPVAAMLKWSTPLTMNCRAPSSMKGSNSIRVVSITLSPFAPAPSAQRLDHGLSTVDDQDLAGHVRGAVGDQEQNGFGDLVDRCPAAERHFFADVALDRFAAAHLRDEGRVEGRVHPAGAERV